MAQIVGFVAPSAVATGTGTTLSVSMPTGTVADHVMIMVLGVRSTTTTATFPAGWEEFDLVSYSPGCARFAWKRAGGSEAGPYVISNLPTTVAKCAAIMTFSGCILSGSPIEASNGRGNASGASGCTGVTSSWANGMFINAGVVFYNYTFNAWNATDPATFTERFDGRTTSGNRMGIGGSTATRTTAGASGSTTYTLGTNYANIGLACCLIPVDSTALTVANCSHAHTADNTSVTDQNSRLTISNCSHAVADAPPDAIVEHKTLAVANCTHAVTSTTPTPVHNIVAIALTYFYTWIVATPAIGGIPGPKLCASHDVVEVSSYCTAATSAVFNIEERSTIGSAGTDILSSDQTATVTGASSTSPSNANLAKDSYLWLDISAVNDTPGYLEVTLKTTITYNLQMNSCAHVVSSPVVALTQAHTLVVDSDEHAVTSSSPNFTEAKILEIASCQHAVTSSAPTLVQDIVSVYGDIPGFWTWVLDSVAVGGVPGPKAPERSKLKFLQSYTTADDYVDFNIEERDTIGSAGVDILASDQRALPTGSYTDVFSNSVIAKDNHLWLDISAISGTPGYLMVTLIYEKVALQAADNCFHAVTSDNIDLIEHKTLEVQDCTHAVTSGNVSLAGNEGELEVEAPGFYCWVIDSPVVGGTAGPKILDSHGDPDDYIEVASISSYIVGGTSATFNIESRTAPATSGTNIMVSDQASDTTGKSASGSDLAVASLVPGRYLWIDIADVQGTVDYLMITMATEQGFHSVNNCSHAVTSDNITLVAITDTTLAVSNCTHAHTASSPTLARKLSASATMSLTVTPVVLAVANCSHAVTTSAITFSAGATRVYLPSSGTPTIAPNPGWGTFDETNDADQLLAVFEKGATARTEKTMTIQNYSTTTILNRQYVLGDVKGLTAHDFTTSETFTLVVQCAESDPLANATLMIEMNVWDITGTSNLGNPYSGVVNTTEFTATETSRYCTKNFTSNVSMPGGSILTIEFGASCAVNDGVEYTIGMMFGDAPATALSLNNIDTGADYPYVEFPFLLAYWSTPLTVANCTHDVTSSVPVMGTGLLVNNTSHEITSTNIDLTGVASTLVVDNCTHTVTSSVVNFPSVPGRRLYVKVAGHWIKIAPEGT